MVSTTARCTVSRRKALARDELLAVPLTHILRAVAFCHGSTGTPGAGRVAPRVSVRAIGRASVVDRVVVRIRAIPSATPVLNGAVISACPTVDLGSACTAVLRGSISLRSNILAALASGGRSPKVAARTGLFRYEPRLALGRAVSLVNAATGRTVGGRCAFAGDELLTISLPD